MRKSEFRVKKASHIGFCFGVKRAINVADDFLKKNKKAYSIGPIIHNPVVVKELARKGIRVIDEIKEAKRGTIVIRSHGISPRLVSKADRLSIRMVDATCPFVKRSHRIVTLLRRQGYKIIIVGEKEHPEIKALSEVAGPGSLVITKKSDLKNLQLRKKKIAAVAQTTLSREDFLKITRLLLRAGAFECRVFDTICNDVLQRQTEAKELAGKVDLMFVVGGKMSANTRNLAKICRSMGTKTYHIETEKELKPDWLKGSSSVGVISGASTPEKIVDKVTSSLRRGL